MLAFYWGVCSLLMIKINELQSKTIRPVNSGIAFKYNDLPSKVERSRGNIIERNIR